MDEHGLLVDDGSTQHWNDFFLRSSSGSSLSRSNVEQQHLESIRTMHSQLPISRAQFYLFWHRTVLHQQLIGIEKQFTHTLQQYLNQWYQICMQTG